MTAQVLALGQDSMQARTEVRGIAILNRTGIDLYKQDMVQQNRDEATGFWGRFPWLAHAIVTTVFAWVFGPALHLRGYRLRYLLGSIIVWAIGINVGAGMIAYSVTDHAGAALFWGSIHFAGQITALVLVASLSGISEDFDLASSMWWKANAEGALSDVAVRKTIPDHALESMEKARAAGLYVGIEKLRKDPLVFVQEHWFGRREYIDYWDAPGIENYL